MCNIINIHLQSSFQSLLTVLGDGIIKLIALHYIGDKHKKLFQKVGTVAKLYIYPIKSCGVMEVVEAECTLVGLQANGVTDRHWVILDEKGAILTMKEEPLMTLIRCSSEGNTIRLTAPAMDDLKLLKTLDIRRCDRFVKILNKQPLAMVSCGDQAEKWISKFLNRPAVLVYSCTELGVRHVYDRKRNWPNSSRRGDTSIFSYLTSYMMTSTASLESVNSQLTWKVSMVNFRPNIVVHNTVPFDEDTWLEVKIGDKVLFHAVEPCRRCTMTTINPDTAEQNFERQPLSLLKTYRCKQPYGAAPIFGVYLSPDITGTVFIGDPVYALKETKRAFQLDNVSIF